MFERIFLSHRLNSSIMIFGELQFARKEFKRIFIIGIREEYIFDGERKREGRREQAR